MITTAEVATAGFDGSTFDFIADTMRCGLKPATCGVIGIAERHERR
jgi:hypothetical protein